MGASNKGLPTNHVVYKILFGVFGLGGPCTGLFN